MGQIVIFTDDKGVEGVSGIEVRTLDRELADGSGVGLNKFSGIFLIDAFSEDKIDAALNACDLLNGGFQQEVIFFFHIAEKDLIRYDYGEDIFIHRIWFEREQPGLVGHVCNVVLVLDIEQNIIPFFLDIFQHICTPKIC